MQGSVVYRNKTYHSEWLTTCILPESCRLLSRCCVIGRFFAGYERCLISSLFREYFVSHPFKVFCVGSYLKVDVYRLRGYTT